MGRRRPYIGRSETQLNQDALARRAAPYSAVSDVSFRVAWDMRQREPKDLREAVHFVRKAYQDEVPPKLHDGTRHAGDDGTPRFSGAATSYVFGSPYADDRPKRRCECETDPHTEGCPAHPDNEPLIAYYLKPFQAALDRMMSDPVQERRARIISHIALGNMGPAEAALAEKAHPDDAQLVAEHACRVFLRGLTDVKVIFRRAQEALQENETAA